MKIEDNLKNMNLNALFQEFKEITMKKGIPFEKAQESVAVSFAEFLRNKLLKK